MVLVENNQLQASDSWHSINEEAPKVTDQSIISLAYWLENKVELANHKGKLGLSVMGDDELSQFSNELNSFELICINFPTFTDGRGYSLATSIRAAGYKNGLRAVGDILPDQVFYLSRVGFDAFEVADTVAAEFTLNKLKEFSVVSQPASDDRAVINQSG